MKLLQQLFSAPPLSVLPQPPLTTTTTITSPSILVTVTAHTSRDTKHFTANRPVDFLPCVCARTHAQNDKLERNADDETAREKIPEWH